MDNDFSASREAKRGGRDASLFAPKAGRFNNLRNSNNEVLLRSLKETVELNIKNYQYLLDPSNKIDTKNKERIRITPLGGLGEIGGNITVLETHEDAIIIDAGMSFPKEALGVDIMIPDFTYLLNIKDKIRGLIITHAHEDHIGAVPYLFKILQCPVFATPLSLGMIGNKFDEHGLSEFKNRFRLVEKRQDYKVGQSFTIEWIHITHSVIDASALMIKTPVGNIFHTGDFKIDHTPIDGLPSDLHRIAKYGEEGVVLMLSDSTNSEKIGHTASESSVGPAFDNVFKMTKDRIIMCTFSSNIHRIYQAITYGIKYKRKICVIGRSMEQNLNIARELGYINVLEEHFIYPHELDRYREEEVLIITTGSQGETMSALYRMAIGEHKHVSIKGTDTIIISAKAIPGNEGSISRVENFLIKLGATVLHQQFSELHVSGHAAQEEQKLLIRLANPKFFLPVHGEYSHIYKHGETAIACGVNKKNIYLMEDGDQMELSTTEIKKVKNVKTGKVYIDTQLGREISSIVVNDRERIAYNGIVIISLYLSMTAGKVRLLSLDIQTFAIDSGELEQSFKKKIEDSIKLYLETLTSINIYSIKSNIEGNIKKIYVKEFKRDRERGPIISISAFSVGSGSKPQSNKHYDKTHDKTVERQTGKHYVKQPERINKDFQSNQTREMKGQTKELNEDTTQIYNQRNKYRNPQRNKEHTHTKEQSNKESKGAMDDIQIKHTPKHRPPHPRTLNKDRQNAQIDVNQTQSKEQNKQIEQEKDKQNNKPLKDERNTLFE